MAADALFKYVIIPQGLQSYDEHCSDDVEIRLAAKDLRDSRDVANALIRAQQEQFISNEQRWGTKAGVHVIRKGTGLNNRRKRSADVAGYNVEDNGLGDL
jgi:hypothetical protein